MLHAAHVLCLVPPAPAALSHGIHLARAFGATLHVMPLSGPQAETEGREGELRSLVTRLLPEGADDLSLQIIEHLPESMSAVLQYVSEGDIDLVVTDTPRGQEPVPPLTTEVSRALIDRLDCPVFVAEHADDPAAVGDLLVPTDFSDHSLRAFKHAVALAQLYGAAVHVLHVVESLPYVALTPTDRLSLGSTPLSEHRGRRQLRAFLREGEIGEVPIHGHLAYGEVANRIVHFAERKDIDLMVLSSHGEPSQPDAPFGQVAERVMGRVTCPLFLVRAFGTSLLTPRANAEADPPSP